MIKFYKYQGTGNDFVMIDNRDASFDTKDIILVKKLCDRRFGIGSDGLILIQNHNDVDFEMIYYNSDGTKSLCGNGSRCAVRFAEFLGIIHEKTEFMTIEGVLSAEVSPDSVRLKMPNVDKIDSFGESCYFVNTGSPHYVKFVSDVGNLDITSEAHKIRYNDVYAEVGVNVNFVEILSPSHLRVRTYERGVEGETYSCGTGVTAVSLAYGQLTDLLNTVNIVTKGGELSVDFGVENLGFTDIFLEGPAVKVFEGYF